MGYRWFNPQPSHTNDVKLVVIADLHSAQEVWITVMRIIKLKICSVPVRLHSGYGKLIFVIISPYLFAIFKNIVHSLEPDETPSYSASQQALNFVQRS